MKALRMTRTAQDATLQLGLTREDVVQVVQSMKREHFYKSMTSFGDHRVWQDVYHVPVGRPRAVREADGGRAGPADPVDEGEVVMAKRAKYHPVP